MRPVSARAGSVHMVRMTLRTEIEALLDEFDHFAYRCAPLDVAVEKLQEILARTAPRVLTTVEELDSEEAAKALCLIPNDGSGIIGLYHRTNGTNEWAGIGRDNFYSSAELLADLVLRGIEPAFTVIEGSDGSCATAVAPRVLTTLEELDSEEAFETLCIVPSGGLPRTPASRTNGINYWHKPGDCTEYSSADLLASFTETGVEPAFTTVAHVSASGPLATVGRRVLTTAEDLNSAEAFYALGIVPDGGPLRVAISRRDGVNHWEEPGAKGRYTSAELLAHFASIGAEPAFTLIEGES